MRFINQRPSWTKYFLDIASLVATRSTCLRAQHGSVLVRGKQILSTGYNGAPSGVPHCLSCERAKQGCLPGQRYELCSSVHSEANAIAQAAKHGTKTEGASLYVTGPPCCLCARLIINSGIKEVVFPLSDRYHSEDTGVEILRSVGVEVRNG